MNMDYGELYGALELEYGASAEEVRQAYSRLIHAYSPEKDPERFKKIREAYQALKDGPPRPKDAGFQPPEDPRARELSGLAAKSIRAGNYGEAAAYYTQALELIPDDPWTLLQLARIQARARHPQKAAKTAQRLMEKAPACAEAHAIAAIAMYERGWYKKALPVFRKAYELGERDLDFQRTYCAAAMENGAPKDAVRVSRTMLESVKWNRENRKDAQAAWTVVFTFGVDTKETARELLDQYEAFLRAHWRLVSDAPEACIAPILGLHFHNAYLEEDIELYRRTDALLAQAEERCADQDGVIRDARNKLLSNVINPDQRLGEAWKALASALAFPESVDGENEAKRSLLIRYSMLDAHLCLMKEDAREEAAIIRRDYPCLYENCRELVDALLAGDTAELYGREKREFLKMSYRFQGSHFLKRYPEEGPAASSVVRVHEGSAPYVRSGQKIGRNDPCPCGSGKKFKRCCMGKGIYD